MNAGVLGATPGDVWVVSTGAGLAAVVYVVVAFAGIVWVWNSTRPRRVTPGPDTMDLRDETPAVVDLLTGGFSVEDDAVPATVVDLAARGHFTIEEAGRGRVLIRLSSRGGGDTLTPYEERVLRQVTQKAVDGVVPAEALTLGPEGVSERWFKGFVRDVNKHARALGLCTKRWGLRHIAIVWVLAISSFLPAWVAQATADRTDDPSGWGTVGNLLVGLAFLGATGLVLLSTRISRSDAQLDTTEGREAAAHWLGVRNHYRSSGSFEDVPASAVAVWDRHLAYATALGLAPVVQREIPFETEHDRHAWSRASGNWRRVKIRYQAFRPAWGQHPGAVVFTGLIRAVIFGAIAYFGWVVAGSDMSDLDTLSTDQQRWIGLGGLVVAVLAAAAALYGVVYVVLGALDLFPRRTVEGEVIRRRTFESGHRLPIVVQWAMWSGRDEHGMDRDHNRKTRHHLAVDPGDVDLVVAYTVKPGVYGAAPQGSRVRVRVSPLLGYVSSLEMLSPPPRSAAHETAAPHQLVDETVTAATDAAADRMAQAMGALDGMTDEQGRPLLDQTDDDGVTLRQRLDENASQLDRLRNDPRVAANPVFGKIIDTFSDLATPPPPEPEPE